MSIKSQGTLPRQHIMRMIEAGMVKEVGNLSQVAPSSLDLTLSDEVYRMEGVFQPRIGERVRGLINDLGAVPHDFSRPLERNVFYLARLGQSFALPNTVYSYCNPKSTTGRHNLHARIVADGSPRFDAMAPGGFKGEAWVLLSPKSFPVLLQPGEAVSQARFFYSDTRFNEFELQTEFAKHKLLHGLDGGEYSYDDVKIRDNDGSLILTLDLSQEIVGYVCYGSSKVLDYSKGTKAYKPTDFFEPIFRPKDGYLHLRQGGFYIVSTAEAVHVPPALACEMVDMDSRSGEFRSHYAGFIDPGWGSRFWKRRLRKKLLRGRGRPLTLEVRAFEEDIFIAHGQAIAKVRFERMAEEPDEHYDSKATSNYTVQTGPRLSKYFK